MLRVSHAVTCTIVFILFYDQDGQGGESKVMKNDLFFSIFSHLGPFSLVFGQVKEWLILELHEMIKTSLVVAFPIVFILFHDRDWQEGVFKVMKNDLF